MPPARRCQPHDRLLGRLGARRARRRSRPSRMTEHAVGDGQHLGQVGRDDEHGRALPARSNSRAWTSALAPTSTPRVGSSTISTCGSARATWPGAPSAGCRRSGCTTGRWSAAGRRRAALGRSRRRRVRGAGGVEPPGAEARGRSAAAMFSAMLIPGTARRPCGPPGR